MNKNPFEKFDTNTQVQEIQKSEIFNALKHGSNPIMVKKTGKEIKNQINNVILPLLIAKKDEVQKFLSDFLANAIVLPTRPCWSRIKLDEMEFPYKQYTWEEINWSEKSFGQIFKGFGEIDECCTCSDSAEEEIPVSPYCPQSKEESEARRKYNNFVEDFRDIIMDIKTANVLVNSIEDKAEYHLDIEQLCCLKFGNE